MEKIKDIVDKEVKSINNGKIDMLYISDSFIFACDKEVLPLFLKVLSNIQMRILVECKTMLRGAVEYGDVIIRDSGKQIIGPAYINAYLNQEKYAIFPRIILSNSVVNLISEFDKTLVSQDREYSLDYFDVYLECKMRVLDKCGQIFGTMTPLKGLTWVYNEIYLNDKNNPPYCQMPNNYELIV